MWPGGAVVVGGWEEGAGRANRAGEETRAQYSMRLRDVVAAINRRHNVEGLCKGLPGRLDALKSRQGDRLKS